MMRTTASLVLLIGAPVVALIIHRYVAFVAVVQSESMEPTVSRGDRLMVSRLAYRLAGPREGDIVVFVLPSPTESTPRKGGRWLVKRVSGLEGAVVLGGRRPRTTVPAGYLFLTGDNEAVSTDSREFGPVAQAQVVGKAVLAYGRRRSVRRL